MVEMSGYGRFFKYRAIYYVYFLFLNNGTVYTGRSDDLKRRFLEHKRGAVRSTRGKNPRLIGYEAYNAKSDAVRRESFLKTSDGKMLFKRQYRDILHSPS